MIAQAQSPAPARRRRGRLPGARGRHAVALSRLERRPAGGGPARRRRRTPQQQPGPGGPGQLQLRAAEEQGRALPALGALHVHGEDQEDALQAEHQRELTHTIMIALM